MAYLLLTMGGLLLLAAQHPFLSYPLSLMLLRPRKKREVTPADSELEEPMGISLCMCAYNEEGVIGEKIANLLALQDAYPELEINVYVDASSDRTAEILLEHRDRLRVVVGTERRGKTHGMNLLVAQSSHPLLVFTDANVMIELGALERVRAHFRDSEVGCVAGHLRYVNAEESVTAGVGSLYWRLEEWIKQLETRSGSAMGADGSLFAIRRELHRAPPDDIIDDMFVSFSVLAAGYRVVQAEDVNAFERSVSSGTEEFDRKVRIACQAFNVHRVIWPFMRKQGALDVYKYLSHKWLRWFAIYLLAVGLTLMLLGMVTLGHELVALTATSAIALCLFAGQRGWVRPLARIWDILLAFAGTGLGVYKSFQGARFQTWAPAASIRK